jgi:hypothetical protein
VARPVVAQPDTQRRRISVELAFARSVCPTGCS